MAVPFCLKYTIYYEEYQGLQDQMGIDMVINPEFTAAQEIANLLQFPSAMNVELFFGGKERLIEFKVLEGDILVGNKLSKISHKLPQNMLFVAIERDGKAYIPVIIWLKSLVNWVCTLK